MSDIGKKLTSADRVVKLISIIPEGPPGLTLKELHSQLVEMGFDVQVRTLYRDLDKIKNTWNARELISSSGGRKETRYYFIAKEKHCANDRLSEYIYRFNNQGKKLFAKSKDSPEYAITISAHKDKSKEIESDAFLFRVEILEHDKDQFLFEGIDLIERYRIDTFKGRTFIVFESTCSDKLFRWIFGWGNKVVVHEPFILREQIGQAITQMTKNYSIGFSGLSDD